MAKNNTISIVSLGCAKNQVDAEIMLGLLKDAGFDITENKDEADVIIVNTCGFIESAKTEAIEAILEAAEYKHSANCKAVIAAGCLTGVMVAGGCVVGFGATELATDMPTAGIRSDVAVHIMAKITNIIQFYMWLGQLVLFPHNENLLHNKSFLLFRHLAINSNH